MATTIIRSTDSAAVSAGAILTGNAGSLIAVLDYALVTVLGWSKAFSGTNAAVYRAPTGVRHSLDVNDNGPDATALGRNARIRGYETMTAVATGTGPFPTTTQVTTPVYVKSTATGTTARPWIVIGDDRTFYLFSEAAGTDPPNLGVHTWTDGFYFGEIYSSLTGDTYRSIIAFPSITSTAVAAAFPGTVPNPSSDAGTGIGYAMPRSYLGTGSSEIATPVPQLWTSSSTIYPVSTAITFPNLTDGGLYLNSLLVASRGSGTTPAGSTYIRGRLRGVYQPLHFNTAANDQDTIGGVAEYAGMTFVILQVAGTRGRTILFDTGTWASSS